jgi:DNA invertase Pin-like site-specific DNA recombinase
MRVIGMKKKPIQTDPGRAIAYIRVSTEEQHLGPEAQRGAIERWASTENIEVVDWFIDKGTSGAVAHKNRPVLRAAFIRLVELQAGVFVVSKRDRLARDVIVASSFQRVVEGVGARLLSADGAGNSSGPEGVLVQGMHDLFAQHERLLIQARTRAALAVKKARGERLGSIPIGFRADGKMLVPDEFEQAAIARAVDLHANGWSIRDVVRILAEEGYRSWRTQKPFSKGSVELILARAS